MPSRSTCLTVNEESDSGKLMKMEKQATFVPEAIRVLRRRLACVSSMYRSTLH